MIGRVALMIVRSPRTANPSPFVSTAVERKRISTRLRISSSIVWRMLARSSSSSDFMPPVPSITCSEVASASSVTLGASRSSVALHFSTWISRSWPALATVPVRPVRTDSVPSSGPSV